MVEFRLLGGVEFCLDGRRVDIGPARQQCVLAVLLVEANTAISADQLIDRVWADHPPQRARSSLHSYLTRLRRVLAVAPQVTITQRSGNYVLSVDQLSVDLHRFRHLISHARAATDDEQALAGLEQALRLWRGEAFAGLDAPWLGGVRATLDTERHAAELEHTDLKLRCGQHTDLLASLPAQAERRPLDERLAGQLMLALYRGGRQADALAHYHLTRSRLADELGVDPGPALRELHQQMLTAAPALAAPAGTARSTRSTVPRQLPAAPPLFTGRTGELAALSAALDANAESGGTVVISAIGGTGGIGKTWLALHWAHRNADRFPDGQLFVNLRGFDPSGTPIPPDSAVRGFLEALGVEPAAIPAELDAQSGLYRSLVADKRLLIVVDNAADITQVAPLLPGSPSCTVVVTSRDRMAGLVTGHGAHPLPLDVLPDADARALLAARLGAERLAADPGAVTELLACCAGLPLALSIVAGRAQTHPEFPLTVLVEELRDASTRLGALDEGDAVASVRAVLSWSARALTTEQAQVFGLLGLAPGPDISLPAAAALIGLPLGQTGMVLRTLERVSLLHQYVPGRYRMHDLIRLYATEQAHQHLPQTDQDTALQGLADFYLHTAHAADRLLDTNRRVVPLGPSASRVNPHPLPDAAAALVWCDAEHPNLVAIQRAAADHGWDRTVWHLAWSMETFHSRRGHRQDWVSVWVLAVDAATRLSDTTAQITARRLLGRAYGDLGRHDEAIAHMSAALALAERCHDTAQQAHTHQALTTASEWRGDDRQALHHAAEALSLYRTLDQPSWEGRALNNVGWYAARLGDHDTARAHCHAALDLFRRCRNPDGEASALDSLGYINHHTGRHRQAVDDYEQALTLRRRLGHTARVANTLDRLAEVHHVLGEHELARRDWQQALRLYQAQRRVRDAERIQRLLTGLDPQPNA